MTGDYNAFTRQRYTDKSKDVTMLATDATAQLAGVLTAKSVNHQVFIQKISFVPTTVAAQTVGFQDTSSTPLKFGLVPASQATPIVFDFGPLGKALGVGKQLDIIATAGVAASIHIEAYERAADAATNFNQNIDINGKVISGLTSAATR